MKKPFTLIELMVVVGIAGLLMTVAIPSFNKILKGNGTDNAAAALKLAIEQAQAKAVSSRKDVALIIPNSTKDKFYGKVSGSEDDAPAFNKDTYTRYYAGSARMAYVEKNGDEWEFVKWVPGSKWLEPFKDAKIVMVSDRYSDLPEKEGDALKECISKVVDEIYCGSNNGDGFVEIDGIPGDPSDRCGMIFSPFGGLRSKKDLFVAVAECTLSGDKITFPDGAKEPINYIVLDVNRLTGKVSYHAFEREEVSDAE